MNALEVCLGLIVLFTSTCFGYSVGKNSGFKEGIAFCAKLMQNFTFTVEEKDEEE